MTTVSGTTSSSSSGSLSTAASTLTAAQASVKTLLTSNVMMAELDTSGTATKAPTSQQISTALQSFINPDGGKTITKADVQAAVTTLGGSATDASNLWSQLSPYGLNNISAASVKGNAFLSSTVTANLSTVHQSLSTYANSAAGTAEVTMSRLLTSNDVVEALSSESSTYVPPTTAQMASTIFALFDVNGAKTISESDVQKAVLAEGGSISGAKAVWSQLSPSGAGSIDAGQFASSPFLATVLTANTQGVQATVAKVQLANTGTSGSLLDKFSSGGADILNGAASGYSDSPIGGGGYTNGLNLFI